MLSETVITIVDRAIKHIGPKSNVLRPNLSTKYTCRKKGDELFDVLKFFIFFVGINYAWT